MGRRWAGLLAALIAAANAALVVLDLTSGDVDTAHAAASGRAQA